jgi:hypothetical protein
MIFCYLIIAIEPGSPRMDTSNFGGERGSPARPAFSVERKKK